MWTVKILFVDCVAAVALTSSSFRTQSCRAPSRCRLRTRTAPTSMALYSTQDQSACLKVQTLDKVNEMKLASTNLRHPLKEELADLESISISHDSYNLLKFHGSYQQDDRSKRQKGAEKAYQFMLRLKVPGGECPGAVYNVLDELCEKYGQQDLRITTRQAWQIHGILKRDLKAVIRIIMDAGSTTIGGCGDINRNVMVPPAPINDDLRPEYGAARRWTAVCAELFVPQTNAFSEIWCDGEKLASVQYWKRHITMSKDSISARGQARDVKSIAEFGKEDELAVDAQMQALMFDDNGRGVVLPSSSTVEPIYGDSYLPRKFKIGVTVEGDNSIDVYINDISLVVLDDLSGVNVLVGGGLGRTHGKDTTFARIAEELAFVPNAQVPAVLKAIMAVQRDHGNREVRANARLKYLVHALGMNAFRTLVEAYLGGVLLPTRPMKPWRYSDWLGWHSAGDGTLFCGLNVEQGRVRDFDGDASPQWRSFLRSAIDATGCDLTLTPSQSVVLRNIQAAKRKTIADLMKTFNILPVEAIDPIVRLSMACPALPLCGLAVTEAERYLPTMLCRVRLLLDDLGLTGEELLIRMTGCPNGCARPYMAELAFIGDGMTSYQLYIGGSPMLTRVGFAFKDRCRLHAIEDDLRPLFVMWRDNRFASEAFGDFVHRVGKDALVTFSNSYQALA